MGNEDSNYRRAEDQEWRKSVESRLVSLTSAQKTTDDDLDKHETRIDEVEQLLEGDPLKRDDSGLKGDVSDLTHAINTLRAIMAPDALGHGGIKSRLDAVERALGLKVQNTEGRWKAIAAAIGATAIITSALFANLGSLEHFVKKVWNVGMGLESTPQKKSTARTSKNHRRPPKRSPPPELMPTEATDGAPEKNVPE